MRHKKTILMYCANEVTREVLEFQMETWGYKVTATSELCLMAPALRARHYDLVLLLPGFSHRNWTEFAKAARELEFLQMERDGSIRIYDTQKALPEAVAPSVHRIPNVAINSAEYLREQMKIITARKRGPSKSRVLMGVAA